MAAYGYQTEFTQLLRVVRCLPYREDHKATFARFYD